MRVAPLTSSLASVIAPWFDDAETARYLGGRAWLHASLRLVQAAPGSEVAGLRALARHLWVGFDEGEQPVALVDTEVYEDGTASLALVVAPARRGQGVGRRLLLALPEQEALRGVRTLTGGVEPDNIACQRCLAGASFVVTSIPDADEMFPVEKKLHRAFNDRDTGQ